MFQLMSDGSVSVSTLFIPDGIIWLEQIYSLFEEENYFSSIFYSQLNRGNAFLLLFYSIPLKLSIYTVFVVNLLLINFIVFHLYYKLNVKRAYLIYFLVPYFWLAISVPSKDILVLLITYLVINEILLKRFLTALILSIMCLFVRDGYGVVILGFVCMYWFLDYAKLNKKYAIPMCFAVIAVLISASSYLESEFYFVARNVNVAKATSNYAITSEIGSYFSYVLRVYANLTNLAFRPQFFNVLGGLDVLSVFYWFSGLSILVVYLVAFYQLVFKKLNSDVELSVVFVMVMLFMISFNPMIQPRYLFSTLVVWPYILSNLRVTSILVMYALIILLSCMFYMIYEVFSLGKGLVIPYESNIYDYFY